MLEQQAIEILRVYAPTPSVEQTAATMATISIAISLKRIADMMEADKTELDSLSAAFGNVGGA